MTRSKNVEQSPMRRCAHQSSSASKDHRSAFTLVEVAIALAVVGLLAGVATAEYGKYIERAHIAKAIAEISSIATVIEASRAWDDGPYPNNLSDLALTTPIDPWGNPYHYLRIDGVFDVTDARPGGNGLPPVAAGDPRPTPDQPRKDRFFKPISTDFDLYSSGPDGVSRDSLEHRDSRDDIVRAINGEFVGPAERF